MLTVAPGQTTPNPMRLLLAFRCFFLVLFAGRLPKEAAALVPAPTPPALPAPTPPPVAAPTPAKHDDGVRGAVQLLALLQREGRLLDFLQEDIDSYADAQVGAAVRNVHRGCKKALAEHLPVEPVLLDGEDAKVRVDAGFDPARIRLVGQVVGDPPYSGTLKHHGWRTGKVSMPAMTAAADPSVVAPAEVEL